MSKNIHDEYFKHTFGHPKTVAGFLRGALSKKLLAELDLSTLHKKDRSFLPIKYRGSRHADLLYAVNKKDGTEICLFLHLEHQSKHDKLMPVRIMEYHTAIIRAYLEEGYKKVPPILTFVFYHGKEEWESATSIADIFTDFELYLNESLKKSFLLNLPEATLAELKKHGLATVTEIVLARQPTKDMIGILGKVMPLLEKQEPCCKDETLKYMSQVEEQPEEVFIEELSKFDSETANNYKTMFERAIKRERKSALQEGIQQGKQEGVQLGEKRGAERTIMKLIRAGMITKKQAEKALKDK